MKRFLVMLCEFLESEEPPDTGSRERLVSEAEFFSRPFIDSKESLKFFFRNFGTYLRYLETGERRVWTLLMSIAAHDPKSFKRLKGLSPFSDTILVMAEFDGNSVTWRGDIPTLFGNLIKQETGLNVSPNSVYGISLSCPRGDSSVITLDNGAIREIMKLRMQ